MRGEHVESVHDYREQQEEENKDRHNEQTGHKQPTGADDSTQLNLLVLVLFPALKPRRGRQCVSSLPHALLPAPSRNRSFRASRPHVHHHQRGPSVAGIIPACCECVSCPNRHTPDSLRQKEVRTLTSGSAPLAAAPQVAHANSASVPDSSGVAASVARLHTAHDDGLCVFVCFAAHRRFSLCVSQAPCHLRHIRRGNACAQRKYRPALLSRN